MDGHHDPDAEFDPARLEAARTATSVLEDEARKVGLYAQNVRMAVTEGAEHMVLIADFLIGDVAWSDRVQNPDMDETKDEFSKIESELTKDRFVELQEEMRRRVEQGLPPIGPTDAED